MDGLRHVPELVLEFISRRDFIAMYLGSVGLWCLWLSSRGLWLGSTMGFGWRAADATGEVAVAQGRAWLAIAVALLAGGTGLWLAS